MERGYGHLDPEISGGLVSNKFFSAFRSSIWYKKSRGGGRGASPGYAAGVYPFSDQNSPKTLLFGAAHTYIAYIRE